MPGSDWPGDSGESHATFLHYRLLERIGEGGMGVVYAAEDTRLRRKVAIKVLPEGMTSDPERLARFEREARAIASISHPNIVTHLLGRGAGRRVPLPRDGARRGAADSRATHAARPACRSTGLLELAVPARRRGSSAAHDSRESSIGT